MTKPIENSNYQKFIIKRKGFVGFRFCDYTEKNFANFILKKKLVMKIVKSINFFNYNYYLDYGSFRIKNNYYFYTFNNLNNSGFKDYIEIKSFSQNKIFEACRIFKKNGGEKDPIIIPHNLRPYKNKL